MVTELGRSWGTALELTASVEVDPAAADVQAGFLDTATRAVRALAYVDMVGLPAVGDRVLLNTTALDLGLGTGGYAIVVALPDRLPLDPEGPGHLVKARYTPTQMTVLGVDEQDSEHHAALAEADDLDGLPVVVADLHSALPAIVAGVRESKPTARVAYLATDGGALPIAFSQSVNGLLEAGWLSGTITVGQAFGGDLEAVSVHNGLLAAHHVMQADVVVVAQGPGNLGTGTKWGFSGVAAGEAINAAGILGGRPIGALRVSAADERPRHRGVSHHSLTAYGNVALVSAEIPVPVLPGEIGALVASQVSALAARHQLVNVSIAGLREALERSPVQLSTMGRGLDADEASFIASAAAGRHAATWL